MREICVIWVNMAGVYLQGLVPVLRRGGGDTGWALRSLAAQAILGFSVLETRE